MRQALDGSQPSDCLHAPGATDGLLHAVDVGVSGPPVVRYGGRLSGGGATASRASR